MQISPSETRILPLHTGICLEERKKTSYQNAGREDFEKPSLCQISLTIDKLSVRIVSVLKTC